MSPDCRDGKHDACDGVAWDDDEDRRTECGCLCHTDPYTLRDDLYDAHITDLMVEDRAA